MDSSRFNELRDKPNRTPQEEQEYQTLKTQQGTKGGEATKQQPAE